jgi:ribokinase
MRVAVVGHVEWIEFGRVDRVPGPGDIAHATHAREEPGGAGAVAAVQLAKLAGSCTLFTALGDDDIGERADRKNVE